MVDATHLQNVQPTATVNVADKVHFKLESPEKSDLKRLNIQNQKQPVGELKMLWNLDFGTWNVPPNRKLREAGLRA